MKEKTANVQDVQNNFPALLSLLESGDEVILIDGQRRLARISPASRFNDRVLASGLGSLEPLPEGFWCG